MARQPLTHQESLARIVGVACLSATAAFHVIWMPHKLAEAPYMGILFIVLSAAAVFAALLLIFSGSRLGRLAWGAAALVAVAPLAGFVNSRVAELPQQAALVGDWAEPLGIPSLVVEGVLLVLAVARVRTGEAATVTARHTAAMFAAVALAVAASPPASAHEEEKESERPAQRSNEGAGGRAEQGAGSSHPAESEVPPSTPAYMVIPATAGAALLTLGGAVILGRRGDLGRLRG